MELIEWLIISMGVSFGIGYVVHSVIVKIQVSSTKLNAKFILQKAKSEADNLVKDSEIQAKDESIRARKEFERETRSRREELKALSDRIDQKELNLDRKVSLLDRKELSIDEKIQGIEKQQKQNKQKKEELDQLIEQAHEKIEQAASMPQEKAREILLQHLEDELHSEKETYIRRVQADAKATAEKSARKIIAEAIERYASDQVNQNTACSVPLPGEDMKGRIIGREGRNIRSLESVTGVNILIDDTPEVVVISGFDPLRREIARIALERLIQDGRIHPARIEEVVEKVKEEIDDTIRTAGEEALYQLGLSNVNPELIRTLGRLKFRHSFSQNVLKHSIESLSHGNHGFRARVGPCCSQTRGYLPRYRKSIRPRDRRKSRHHWRRFTETIWRRTDSHQRRSRAP